MKIDMISISLQGVRMLRDFVEDDGVVMHIIKNMMMLHLIVSSVDKEDALKCLDDVFADLRGNLDNHYAEWKKPSTELDIRRAKKRFGE